MLRVKSCYILLDVNHIIDTISPDSVINVNEHDMLILKTALVAFNGG